MRSVISLLHELLVLPDPSEGREQLLSKCSSSFHTGEQWQGDWVWRKGENWLQLFTGQPLSDPSTQGGSKLQLYDGYLRAPGLYHSLSISLLNIVSSIWKPHIELKLLSQVLYEAVVSHCSLLLTLILQWFRHCVPFSTCWICWEWIYCTLHQLNLVHASLQDCSRSLFKMKYGFRVNGRLALALMIVSVYFHSGCLQWELHLSGSVALFLTWLWVQTYIHK